MPPRSYDFLTRLLDAPGPSGFEAAPARLWRKGAATFADDVRYLVPSEYVIRDVLIRVNPVDLDRALQRWYKAYGDQDESLAIDGKTMCNAIDEQGHQTHVMSVIGHQSKACYTQKEWGLSRS